MFSHAPNTFIEGSSPSSWGSTNLWSHLFRICAMFCHWKKDMAKSAVRFYLDCKTLFYVEIRSQNSWVRYQLWSRPCGWEPGYCCNSVWSRKRWALLAPTALEAAQTAGGGEQAFVNMNPLQRQATIHRWLSSQNLLRPQSEDSKASAHL